LYVAAERIEVTPYLRNPVFPQTAEMLFVVALMFSDDVSAQLIQFLALLCVVAMLFAMGRRFATTRVGLWAGALLLSYPLVVWLGTVAYIDMLLVLFLTAAMYAFLVWREETDTKWLALSALFAGLAAGTKYSALVPVACLGGLSFFFGLRERRTRLPLLFGSLTLLVMAPWYLRNYVYTGNPVWPFLSPVFGYGFWDAADYQGQMVDLLSSHVQLQSLWSFLRLPWDLVFRRFLFHIEAPLSPALLLSPLGLLVLKRRGLWIVLTVSLGFIVLWFLTAQIPRYLVPILPLASFATAYGLDWAVGRIAQRAVFLKSSVVTVAVACMLVAPGYFYSLHRVSLARSLPTYPAYQYLNNAKGASYVLYALYDENMNYFATGTCMGDHFGVARYRDVLTEGVDGRALYERLRGLGADYLLVNELRTPLPMPTDTWFKEHFRVVSAGANFCLYALREEPVRVIESAELLRNPGFEDLDGALPVAWNAVGSPTLESAAPQSGRFAVLCRGTGNVFIQVVPVEKGALYVLRESVRADSEEQQARLQVNWLDYRKQGLSADVEVFEASQKWTDYEMWVSPPVGAAYACIYAGPHGESLVEFDDMSFRQVTYAD
jgi:hypothetical protein